MTPSDSNPKLPLWIFLATDGVLIAAAYLIADQSKKPLSLEAALMIVGCVGLGAIVALVPIIARFERAKNETLDDRQRSLEGLARTLGSAAEQISIAASGLHEIADIAQRNLRQAEQLPHKLQEKIAEFQAQLADANETEKEELEKEVAELRASESDRLEATATRITKAVAEFARLEAATAQHLTAANEAMSKLSFSAAGAIGKAQAAAEQAFSQARTEAARGLGEAAGNAVRAIEDARATALREVLARSPAAASIAPPADCIPSPPATAVVEPAEGTAEKPDEPPVDPLPRKPRRRKEETPEAATSVPTSTAEDTSPRIQMVDDPPPLAPEKIAEVAPIAPDTHQPFVITPKPEPGAAAPANEATTAVGGPPKSARKRTPRKSDTDADASAEPALDLSLDELDRKTGAELVERVLSSDGATRLLVTAYIGIGNRLFIRGAGPGLSWEKGQPLQFVSIGKWRWETNDANGPVEFKLYKNDDVECAALGSQQLDPGYQQEVTAAF